MTYILVISGLVLLVSTGGDVSYNVSIYRAVYDIACRLKHTRFWYLRGTGRWQMVVCG